MDPQIDDGAEHKKKSEKEIYDTLNALLYFAVPGAGAKMFSNMMDKVAEDAAERANPDESKMRDVTPVPEQIEAPKD